MFEIRLDNKAGSTILQEMAFLLELKGENPFKVKAYSNLQFTISNNHS
jgi:DNA polymerase/3'-5' exonuclease PolX